MDEKLTVRIAPPVPGKLINELNELLTVEAPGAPIWCDAPRTMRDFGALEVR